MMNTFANDPETPTSKDTSDLEVVKDGSKSAKLRRLLGSLD